MGEPLTELYSQTSLQTFETGPSQSEPQFESTIGQNENIVETPAAVAATSNTKIKNVSKPKVWIKLKPTEQFDSNLYQIDENGKVLI